MKIYKEFKVIVILSLIVSSIIFLIYTKFYYGIINGNSLLNHFIICFNALILFISNFYKTISEAIITEENMKVIIVSLVLIYILSKIDISKLLLGINKFELGQLKFERDIAKLKELNEEEEENYNNLISNSEEAGNEKNNEISTKIKNSEKRLEIIKLLINDPFLLRILINFVEGKTKKKSIPLNVMKANTTLDSIKILFEYEFNHNYIKIIGIKKEVEDIVIKLYMDELIT